ncbi:4'-phosphopantetheinyl transferase superfamily protein [Antarcticibacterium sp. 1MA-6-2]|uniref:4'-phosphopantetheinyl transferase family protein n=1 Tax=Antarcticibacterium sp. 1MA-6-2 TaxID=2908210 RepID=UPI001F2A5970|nr:4'-phosphopantetheinyl transferase superfamily protein [Antarcticibacterium sp. 1MA-6-2]UJH91605.1 4'-phosphopantetheinyl transferase superfamily protein [Antarcticibacterium sp. 1MA-6-2]
MIGNDIVDLNAAIKESNWRRKGFLQKLFTLKEQEKILSSPKPHLAVWLLWSMKEAAYKAHQRRYSLERSYRPKSFSCTILFSEENSAKGKVQCGEDIYLTQSSFSNKYIHTMASVSEEREVIRNIMSSSENLRSTFISHFAEIKNYCENQIVLKKDGRSIPVLSYRGHSLNCSFSFSHHGQFSAYALSLTNY